LAARARQGGIAALAGLAAAMALTDPLMEGHLGMAKAMGGERLYHQAEHATHHTMGAPPAALGHGVAQAEGREEIEALRQRVRRETEALMGVGLPLPGQGPQGRR
jgi:hypothetical protein